MFDNTEFTVRLIEWLADRPSGGRVQQWCAGVIAAAPLFLYGCFGIMFRLLTVPRIPLRGSHQRAGWSELSGSEAISAGVLIAAIGLFMHFQWFWGNHEKLWRYSQLGKLIAMLAFLGAAIYLVVDSLILTRPF